jgi:hypothetical protein
MYPNLDDLKLLQMSLDHESLKLEPKEKRLAGTMNVFDADLKDHRQDHQLLHVLNGTHLGSGGAGVGSGSKNSSGGR